MQHKAYVKLIVLITVLVTLFSISLSAKEKYKPNEVLVKVKAGKEAAFEKNAKAGGYSTKKRLKEIGYRLLKVPQKVTAEQAVQKLKKDPSLEYVGLNHKLYAVADQLWPYTDPVFFDGYVFWFMDIPLLTNPPQWGLYNDGLNTNELGESWPGKARADIHAPEAWYITTGSPNILIAGLDTGINHNHEDMYGKVRLPGYNAIDGSSNTMDDHSDCHGTFTAGIIAANSDNGVGMTGVTWNCPILPVKVIGANGSGDEADAADGIIWAVNHGAKVLNMSFATDIHVPALEAAINYAWSHGAISVCASGNENTSVPRYPAAYANAVAVGATNEYDKRCNLTDWGTGGSNYGSYLDIAAPGNNITSAVFLDDGLGTKYDIYAAYPGTSAAAPFVSGVCALVWSINPTWTNQQVVDQVLHTADDIESPGWDQYSGWGRVNAYRALTETLENITEIGKLKDIPNGRYVELPSKVISAGSGQITNKAYVQEELRASGIMLNFPGGVPIGYNPGDRVTVKGSVTTINGEKALGGVTFVNKVIGTAPKPVAITNRQATGPSAKVLQGLLVKVYGRVTTVGWDNIYIDDGSSLFNGSFTGLRIAVPSPNPDWEGKVVSVIGPLGMDLPSGATTPEPVVRPRKPGDIRVLQ